MKRLALYCGIIACVFCMSFWLWYPYSSSCYVFIMTMSVFSFVTLPFLCVQLNAAIKELDNTDRPSGKLISISAYIKELEDGRSSAVMELQRLKHSSAEELRKAQRETQDARNQVENIRHSVVARENEAESVKRQFKELEDAVNRAIIERGGKGSMKVKGRIGNVEVSFTADLGAPAPHGRVIGHSSEQW